MLFHLNVFSDVASLSRMKVHHLKPSCNTLQVMLVPV